MVTTFWYYSYPIRIYLLATFFAFIEVDAPVPFHFGSLLLLGQLEVLGILEVLHLPRAGAEAAFWCADPIDVDGSYSVWSWFGAIVHLQHFRVLQVSPQHSFEEQ